MSDTFSITPSRAFRGTYGAVMQLWLARPSAYGWMLLMAVVVGVASSVSAPWWCGLIAGGVWLVAMCPLLVALQARKIMQALKREGPSTFTFDAEAVTCQSRSIQARVLWTGMARVWLTETRCFLYFTPRCAWFFRRCDLKPEGETVVLAFAKAAGVKVEGA